MRKVLVSAVIGSALLIACETKTPQGPSGVTPTTSVPTTTTSIPEQTTTSTSSSTTTTIVLAGLSRRYQTFNPPPDVPSEMTLFFELITAQAASEGRAALGGPVTALAAENEYKVTGVYVMLNGTTGTVTGELGGSSNPLDTGGDFEGTLTAATPSGCTAERGFSGHLSLQTLEWKGGSPGTSTCSPSPLGMAGISMLAADTNAPLPTPPSVTTSTTVDCTAGLEASETSFGSSGGTGTVDISINDGCGWTAQSFDSWITVRPPQGGTGPATVTFDVAATGTARTGRLRIAGRDLAISQAAPVTTTTSSSSTSSSSSSSSTSTSSTSTSTTTVSVIP